MVHGWTAVAGERLTVKPFYHPAPKSPLISDILLVILVIFSQTSFQE
jgi:hypothetical protein